ncbi:MAG: dihydrolipoamide acetyltransferase family protein [Mycobacterium sp.]
MTTGQQFLLPDVGEGLTEAEIVKWLVAVGDTVAINESLVEVETAKSLVELPSPHAGVIIALHGAEGDTVDVGSVLVTFGDTSLEGETTVSVPPASPTPMPDDKSEPRQPVLVGYGPSRAKVERKPRVPGYRTSNAPSARASRGARPYASPPVRLRARELGADLDTVTPTGSYGQVTRADVEKAAAARATAPSDAAADTATAAETRSPIKGVRKATAAAMVASAFTAPHVTEWVTVDVTETLNLLEELRKDREFAGVRLNPLALIARATLSALRAYPAMNTSWDGEAAEIVQYRDVNLGIAAATPRGLLVPNIKAAQSLSMRELCNALDDLVSTARAGSTQPEAMARGTFTITNIGVFGIDGGTPILNPGEAGILCVGQIARRPWEYDGEVALRSTCTLAMSFDHRLVDGQLGSQTLAHIARLLERPSLALAL